MLKLKLITALILASLSTSSFAGGPATGGASEITQIMNNGELILSVSKQSAMVAGQIRDYTAQINQYMTMVQNLKQLPTAVIGKALGPMGSQLRDLGQLYTAVNDVYSASTAAFNVLQRRRTEMTNLNLNPSEYLNAEMLLAQTKGGVYRQQAERDIAAFKKVEEKSKALAGMESQIKSVSANVEGLQTLAQQNQMMVGELMELNSQIREKSLQDNVAKEQAELLKAELKKRAIEMQKKAEAERESTIKAMSDGKYDVEANRQKLFKGM